MQKKSKLLASVDNILGNNFPISVTKLNSYLNIVH